MSVIRRLQRALKNKVTQPDYAGLTNVIFGGLFEGLVNNTDNNYGTVNGTNGVTKWKSYPQVTGIEFDAVSTAPTLTSDGIVFNSTRMRHGTASPILTDFGNLHYRATHDDIKGTIHGVIKMGASSNPDAIYGICGNNGGSGNNKGVALIFDDRSSIPTNNEIKLQITRGVSQSFLTLSGNTNIFEPNKDIDFWIQWDKSLDIDEEIQVYLNGFRFVVSNRVDSTTPVSGATYNMEIGSNGANVQPGVFTLKELWFMDGVMSQSFRQTFITARMFKYSITPFANQVDGINMTSDWNEFDTLTETRYYLANTLCQNPTDSNTIVSVFQDSTSHLYDAASKISGRVSTDKGRTWGAKFDIFDPSGSDSVRGPSAGYDSAGRLHVLTATVTSLSAGATEKLWYGYSDDDGATWSTFSDISASLASDGLDAFRTVSRIIENNGVLLCAYYKFTDEGNFTNSARYVLRSTDGGSTWASVLIQTGTIHRNETDIIGLSSTTVVVVTRDEVTLLWYQSISTDNGLTWTNQGALSFGESGYTSAAPVRLVKMQISSTDVIACYFSDRGRDFFKAVYATSADLIASGVSGWSIATKFTIHHGNGVHLHYGDVCHYDNDFKAIGMYVIDSYPDGGGGTENSMFTFDIPTFHYPFVKSALGL